MSELVLDASALVLAVGSRADRVAGHRDRLTASGCHAPHLIDADVAATALAGGRLLVDERYPHTGSLARAAWELRDTITFYDALYAALAATLGVPLLTADARLTRAPGLPCQVELVA
ncbi:MAG: PIN domain-containing protein [Pseudonocardiaceae bacterium]